MRCLQAITDPAGGRAAAVSQRGSRCLSCRAGRLPCRAQPSVVAGRAAGRAACAPRVQTGCALANCCSRVVSCRRSIAAVCLARIAVLGPCVLRAAYNTSRSDRNSDQARTFSFVRLLLHTCIHLPSRFTVSARTRTVMCHTRVTHCVTRKLLNTRCNTGITQNTRSTTLCYTMCSVVVHTLVGVLAKVLARSCLYC